MKSRHIKNLRLKIRLFESFKVKESDGLFGDFYGNINREVEIKAGSREQAVKRYFRWYFRRYKELSDNDNQMQETKHRYGKIRVVDSKGFSHYYC